MVGGGLFSVVGSLFQAGGQVGASALTSDAVKDAARIREQGERERFAALQALEQERFALDRELAFLDRDEAQLAYEAARYHALANRSSVVQAPAVGDEGLLGWIPALAAFVAVFALFGRKKGGA